MWKHWIWDTSPVGQPRTLLGDCAWRTVVQKDFNPSRWTPVHQGKTAPACGPLSSPVSQEVKVRHSCLGVGREQDRWACSPGRRLQCLNTERLWVAGLLLRGGKSRAEGQWPVALSVRQWRVVLPVAAVRECQADGGSSQDVWMKTEETAFPHSQVMLAGGGSLTLQGYSFSLQNPYIPGLRFWGIFLVLSYSCTIVIIKLFP